MHENILRGFKDLDIGISILRKFTCLSYMFITTSIVQYHKSKQISSRQIRSSEEQILAMYLALPIIKGILF
jgi:hypothetical protein